LNRNLLYPYSFAAFGQNNSWNVLINERTRMDMRKKIQSTKTKTKHAYYYNNEKLRKLEVSKDIDDNVARLTNIMNNSFDIKVRRFKIGCVGVDAAIIYIESIADEDKIFNHIIKPLMAGSKDAVESGTGSANVINTIKESLASIGTVEEAETFDTAVLGITSGDTFIIVDGCTRGLIAGTKALAGRSIDEAKTEPSVKGSKEAFVENLKDNVGLIRKRIKDPNLTFETFKVGRRTKSDVVTVYVKGIIDESIVAEARKRIQAIDIDDAISASQVAHLISDSPHSIFPMHQVTERPDKVVASLLDGRLAILIDGTPDAVIVPVTLPMLMQSVDDYNEKWILGSAAILARYISLFTAMLLPALYIAFTSFHPEILPTIILFSITGTRSGVPFPAFAEAVLMAFILEALTEAGVRLPRVVGQTVSIVGGLVIGQAAVEAGIISPVMVIVISITAISSFSLPSYSLGLTVRILRFPFMILATILGALGISLGLLYMLGYVASLESFGVGYIEPLTSYRLRDWKSVAIRAPQKLLTKRPELLNPEDTRRMRRKKGGDSSEKK
jgi:spore germination protein